MITRFIFPRKEGGGVCIYVRCNLNYKICEDLSCDELEYLTVEITKPRTKPLLISRALDIGTQIRRCTTLVILRT